MKDMIAKIMIIGVIIAGIGFYVYDHLWTNIRTVDTRATTTITNTTIPNN